MPRVTADRLRTFVRVFAFPTLMSASIGLIALGVHFGLKLFLAFNLVTILLVLAIYGLEQIAPFEKKWNRSDGLFLQDLGHTFFGTGLGAVVGNLGTTLLAQNLSLFLASHFAWSSTKLWPHALPFWIQVGIVFLVADLGRYVQHRLHHGSAFLWKFHELHHDIERLVVVKTSRSHIVERILQQLFMFGPLALLGVPAPVLTVYIVGNSLLGAFDHSNLDIDFGPFGGVFTSPGAHRLHHSRDREEGMKNFGSALVIWDRIFGTYLSPRVVRAPTGGVGTARSKASEGFVAQAFAPLARPRLAQPRRASRKTHRPTRTARRAKSA